MRVVIIGAGQAGASLAARLRARGHDGEIIIIGAEPAPPYQRPPLSKGYLLGTMDEERLWLRAPGFWRENDITLELGQRASAIDRAGKTVALGDRTIAYDALVLATGSRPRRLPQEIGGALAGVHTVRTLANVDAMRREFTPGRHGVVIGGGYIGLEAAAVARQLGLEMTVLEASPRILTRVAAAETAAFIADLHRRHGVTIRTGATVTAITGTAGRVDGVQLADGTLIPADFVITGIGITPDTALAGDAGLHLDNGIATDEFGRTSDPAIWAAGDCASFPWRGNRIRLEAVSNAVDMGEAVAENILGVAKPYVARPWFWSDQYDLKLQIAGLNTGHDRVVTRPGPPPSFWYYRGDELLAVDAMSNPRAYMVGKRLVDAHRSPSAALVSSAEDIRALMKAG